MVTFKDETGDTISVDFSFTKEFVVIHDGGNEAWIGAASIDKLIAALQTIKENINV